MVAGRGDARAGRLCGERRRRRDEAVERFFQGCDRGWFRVNPAFAVYQGRHDYDGKFPDWTDAGLKTRATYLHNLVTRAKAFKLSGDAAFERDYLVQVAEGELFWLEEADQPHRLKYKPLTRA